MTATTRPTISDRVREYGFRMTYGWTARNQHMDPQGSEMDNWRCTLRCGGRKMSLTFSKGRGLGGEPPSVSEVLNALAMDAAGFDNAGWFEAWSREYGYDEDSRKAESLYRTVGRQRDSLSRLLGDETRVQALLFETENL